MYVAPDANPCPTQRRIACRKIFVFECQRDKRFMLQFLFAIHPWNSTPQKNNVLETLQKKTPHFFFHVRSCTDPSQPTNSQPAPRMFRGTTHFSFCTSHGVRLPLSNALTIVLFLFFLRFSTILITSFLYVVVGHQQTVVLNHATRRHYIKN